MKQKARKRSMIWGMLAVLALICCLLPVTVQADPDPAGCEGSEDGQHDWVSQGRAPTCTEGGTTYWMCYNCGMSIEENVPALGHAWDGGTVTQAATCEASGVMTYTCGRCGETYTETIPATGHSWDGGTVTRAATCEANGVMTYTCYNCGATSSETISATGHSWDGGTVTQAATCEANGVMTYTCYNCGATYTETIPATGHSPVTVAGWPATCTGTGMTDGSVCSVCGAVLTEQTEIPATGHNWDAGAVTREATCTQDGEYTYTCYTCWETWPEVIPATGHAWDEGVVTKEPDGFEPGILTYTCRNCGETWEEPISPAKNLFGKLKNLPAGKGGGMYFTEQPQGGAVSLGMGSPYPKQVTLSVAVDGGVEPYTYEWHFRKTKVDDAMDAGTIGGMVSASQEILEEVVEGYQNAKENWSGVWSDLYEKINGEKPETASPEDGTEATEAEKILWEIMNVNDNAFTTSYSPAIEGHGGNTYYCVVTDAAGQKIASDLAEVRYAISIESTYTNPNKNYALGEDTLTCNDRDGTEPITYRWYQVDGSGESIPMDSMTGKTTQVPYPGSYYCIAEDANGDYAQTETAIVYEAKELRIAACSPHQDIRDGESADLDIYIEGGVQPYSVNAWFVDDDWNQEDLGYLEGAIQDDSSAFPGTYRYNVITEKTGTCWFYVSDAVGNELEQQVKAEYRQLKINKQPEGGVLSIDDTFDLSVEMGEGLTPFTYELYQLPLGWEDDGFVDGSLYDSGTQNTFTVNEEGSYYFIIYDADGRWARSDFARVQPYELKVTISGNNQITDKYVKLEAIVEGGEEPYTYEWVKYDETQYTFTDIVDLPWVGETTHEQGKKKDVFAPGLYVCTVTDANNVSAADSVEVTYSESKPLIIKVSGPVVDIPYDYDHWASTTLTCEAVTGSGDDSELIYEWYQYTGLGEETIVGTGKNLPLKEDGTLEGQISGRYFCKVTNASTGEYSESTLVYVKVELVIARMEQIGDTVELEFEGGKAPYMIRKLIHAWLDDYKYDAQWYGYTYYSYYPKDFEEWTMVVDFSSRTSSLWKQKDGIEIYCYFRITDETGQTVEKEIPITLAK